MRIGMGYMRECIGQGNIVGGQRQMGLDPSHEAEVSRKQMLGTTKHEIAPVYSTCSTF